MKKTTLFILLLSIFSFGELVAQTDYYSIITGLSTSGNGRAPQGSQRYNRSVWLLRPAEMTAAGFTSGSVINSLGFNFLTAQNIPTTGTITIYLQNTTDVTNLKSTAWATAITGMTTVSTGSVTIPAATGTFDIPFSGGSPFTYTGGGVYVAFDYQNTAGTLATTGNVAACNTALVAGLKGAISTTAAPTTVANSDFRPETRLGKPVTCARPSNIQEVVASKTTSSVTVTWNNINNTDIEYGIYGFTPGTGVVLTGVTSPHTINGLAPSTVYDVYLRNNCGTTASPTYSALTDVVALHTVFEPTTSPYTTSFEQEGFSYIGWSGISGTPVGSNWQFGFFGPPSGTNTLTQDGNTSVYSLSGVTTAPANNWIISRGINLTAGNQATISFYTRNYVAGGSTGTSSYNLTVGTAQTVAAQTTNIATDSNNAVVTYGLKTYTYTPTTTGVYYFGIQNISPANALGQQAMFLDNFSVSQTLSTDDFISSKLSVYPNPVNDIFTISNDANALINVVEITDLNGRIVSSHELNATEGQISTADLATGVYMLSISTDQGKAVKKIVKQ